MPLRRRLLEIFIACHLLAIAVWVLPPVSLLQRSLQSAVRPYFLWSGLWQGWKLFAPELPRDSATLVAELSYGDGSRATVVFDSAREKSGLASLRHDRFRKWAQERLIRAEAPVVRDAARYVARLKIRETAGGNLAPKGVRFIERRRLIPPFHSGTLPSLEEVAAQPYVEVPIAIHAFTADDLVEIYRP